MIRQIRRLTDKALEELHADALAQGNTARLDQINNEQIRRSSSHVARWYDKTERARTGHHPANFIA